MRRYRYQVGDTKPDGWLTIRADDMRSAALQVAAALPEGRYEINIAHRQPNHPNGAPMTVTAYTCNVGKGTP